MASAWDLRTEYSGNRTTLCDPLRSHSRANHNLTVKDQSLPEKNFIEVDKAISAQDLKANVARALIAALTSECKAYCILSGYDQLPEFFDTDIDFMVGEKDFRRMPGIIERVAQQTGTRLFQAIDHEVTGRAYWVGSAAGSELTIVQPDSTSDYRHYGSLWLRCTEVLASRRWNQRGFWTPSAKHEFAYYLLKRLNKSSFNSEHGDKLRRLYVEDPSGCEQMIGRFWKGRRATLLRQMAADSEWSAMSAEMDGLRTEMKRRSAEPPWQRIASAPKRGRAFIKRVVQPTGGWIAVLGPDGAGKSLVIDTIRVQLSKAFRNVRCFHLRPKLLRKNGGAGAVVTDPHGKPPRGTIASVAKAFFLLGDYVLGYWLQLAPAMMRSDLLIFDRYIYDLLVDSKRVRYGGPQWLLRLVSRIVPRPDLVILLDAPPEVLWSRKQEVPFEEVARQRERYLQVVQQLPSAVVVNAAQTPPEVVESVMNAIVEFYARRTAKRLGLGPASIEAEASTPQC
jgi:thymidylate kinase